MPLRDHFQPPLDNMRHWEAFHATWPVMVVSKLRGILPSGYLVEPRVHLGVTSQIDVATYEDDEVGTNASMQGNGNNGGVATDLPKQDVYEVLVYDEKRHSRLVAAVEIVSPANKDRPEHRRIFAAKCAGLLRERVSVVIVDIVTTRSQNLYAELLDLIGLADPALKPEQPQLYVTACRTTKRENEWQLETWLNPLRLAEPLPTMPLWLADNLAIPLELEPSYEESCDILNIP